MYKEFINIAFVSLLLAGCARPDRTQNTNTTSLSKVTGAPRYIPAERLPIQQERPFFIKYGNTNPPLEHLQYLERICGRLSISVQYPVTIIGTEVEDCEVRVQSQKP